MFGAKEEFMPRATRRSFTAEERATILRRHLADKVTVSDLCDEYKIQPSLFYVRQKQLMENMAAALEETILQRAREQYPEATPRIISDNGPQFIAKDFREFVRISGMTHLRTSPYYPQSNGKMERWDQTVKVTTIRPNAPGSLDEARRLVATFVAHYNTKRLHSAIGYVTPADKLAGHETAIWAARDQQLEAARERRRERRQQGREETERLEAAV